MICIWNTSHSSFTLGDATARTISAPKAVLVTDIPASAPVLHRGSNRAVMLFSSKMGAIRVSVCVAFATIASWLYLSRKSAQPLGVKWFGNRISVSHFSILAVWIERLIHSTMSSVWSLSHREYFSCR